MSTYGQLLEELGGKPKWALNLSDRTAHALVRDGWTPAILKARLASDKSFKLTDIGNIAPKQEKEIQEHILG